jgi:hypothetical protein
MLHFLFRVISIDIKPYHTKAHISYCVLSITYKYIYICKGGIVLWQTRIEIKAHPLQPFDRCSDK